MRQGLERLPYRGEPCCDSALSEVPRLSDESDFARSVTSCVDEARPIEIQDQNGRLAALGLACNQAVVVEN